MKNKILILSLSFLVSFIVVTGTVNAAFTNPTDSLQIKIPGLNKLSDAKMCSDDPKETKICIPWVAEYLSGIYKYAIGIVGILATVVMMFGGFLYLIAGGDSGKLTEAKEWIKASITGLVIALSSYMILYQINPDLTNMKSLKVIAIKPEKATTGPQCDWKPSCISGLETQSDGKCSGNPPNEGTTLTDSDLDTGADTSVTAGTDVCCCAACKSEIDCNFCNNCETPPANITCKESPCYLNKNFIAELKTIYALNSAWSISEPWPPTAKHVSSCHKDGTCADIGLNGDTSVSHIQSLYDSFKSNVSSMQLEVSNCSTYSSVSGLKCVKNPNSTGDHLHVNK